MVKNMRLVLAKPAMAAFEGDLVSSKKVLEDVKDEFGIPSGEYKINPHLSIDFGLQLIVRNKDLDNLSELERALKDNVRGIPLSVHAPYNYDDPKDWPSTDLTRGRMGVDNLRRIAGFSRNIGAMSVAVHPNAIRTKEELQDERLYNPQVQRENLDILFSNVWEVNSDYGDIIDLENKPLPATTPDNERPIFTTLFHPLAHLKEFAQRGGTMTFDTCHYGITRDTINNSITEPVFSQIKLYQIKHPLEEVVLEITDEDLRIEEMFGYFAKDYVLQPTIAEAMVEVGSAIKHIHLNDGSVYRPNAETGFPDREKPLPKVGGYQLWWEAYVPGQGELCETDCILPWLKKHQGDNRAVTLTLEVSEFNGDYDKSPRSRESFKKTIEMIYDTFRS